MQIDNSRWSPSFICIGAERSATTWCYTCLEEHPQICMGHQVNYFNRHYELGEEWYRRHFTHKPEAVIFGDMSPLYMVDPICCERIVRDYPQVKLLFILRNPYERALSHLLLVLRSEKGIVDLDDPDLARQLAAQQDKYLKNSLYFQGLKPYFQAFPREQIIIHYVDDLKLDRRAFLRALYLSLGADPGFVPASAENIINRTTNYQWPILFAILMKLVQGVKALPLVGRLREWSLKKTTFRFQQWIIRFFEPKTTAITGPKLDFEEVFGSQGLETIKGDLELLAKELHLKIPERWHYQRA